MLKKPAIFCAALLAGLAGVQANAAPDKYEFDKSHTHIIFFVNHLGYSYTVGRIKEFDGYFTFDEKEPENSMIDIKLKADSVDTNVPALDKELRGEKFLHVEKFPTIDFRSKAIKVTGKNTGQVLGDLTLLGMTSPVLLTVTYNRSGIHPYTNNYVSGFTAEAHFKRSDFGMHAYLPDVGDEVVAHIEVEGIDPFKHPGRQDKKTSGK